MQEILVYYFGKSYLYNIIIIGFVILLTILIMHIINNIIQDELKHVNKIPIDKFIETCETGDIIITRWEYIDIGYRLFCKYCHVSVIYKNKFDEKFLIDTHPEEFEEFDEKREFPKSGVNMYPLKDRISNYQGTCYFLKLKQHKNIKTFDFNKYKHIPFSTNFRISFLKNWFFNNLGINIIKTDNTMYCSELSGYILQDLGILNKTININTLSPDSFELLYNNNETLYDKPLHIEI